MLRGSHALMGMGVGTVVWTKRSCYFLATILLMEIDQSSPCSIINKEFEGGEHNDPPTPPKNEEKKSPLNETSPTRKKSLGEDPSDKKKKE